MTYFKNKRQEAKYYMLELLEFGDAYLWSEMKRYVDGESENEINDSTFTNALKQLVEEQIVMVNDQDHYQLVKHAVAKKEDFMEEETLKTLMETTIERYIININQLTIDTLAQFISDFNELPEVKLEKLDQELLKDIIPPRIADYKRQTAELQKQLRKIANDLDN